MASSKKIKIGYVSIIQLNFRGDKKHQYDKSCYELHELSKKLGFELFIYPEMIVTPEDAEKAASAVRQNGVDLLLIQNTSFASGYLIRSLATSAPYIGLWAVREEKADGYLPQNSFCGINLNGSIIKEYMQQGIKYKWFFGDADSFTLSRRLEITVRALTAIKNIQGSKVVHIGGIAPGFSDFYFDERKLFRKFGISVVDIEYGDLKTMILSYSDDLVKKLAEEMANEAYAVSDFAKSKLEINARVYMALEEIISQNNAIAAAVSCWPRFRIDWAFTPCAVFGRLNENGFVVACEGDVISAVSMALLKLSANNEAILMDLVSFDDNDDTVQFWHCGVGSRTYAKDNKIALDVHFNPGPKHPEKGWLKAGPVATMRLAPDEITCMRLTKECERMLLFKGKIIDKEPVYYGSAGWIADMSMDGKPIKALDLVNTVMVYGFQHHYPLVKGDVEAVMRELAAWLDIGILNLIPYRDYLQTEEDKF